MTYALLGRKLRKSVNLPNLQTAKVNADEIATGVLCCRIVDFENNTYTGKDIEFLLYQKNGSYRIPFSSISDVVEAGKELCGFDLTNVHTERCGHFYTRSAGIRVKVLLYVCDVTGLEENIETHGTKVWVSSGEVGNLVPTIKWDSITNKLSSSKEVDSSRFKNMPNVTPSSSEYSSVLSAPDDLTFMPFNLKLGYAKASKHSYPKQFSNKGMAYWKSLFDLIDIDTLSVEEGYTKLYNAMIKKGYHTPNTNNSKMTIARELLVAELNQLYLGDSFKCSNSNIDFHLDTTSTDYSITITGSCDISAKQNMGYTKEVFSVTMIEKGWKIINANNTRVFGKTLLGLGDITITIPNTDTSNGKLVYTFKIPPVEVPLSRICTEKQYLTKVMNVYANMCKEKPIFSNRRI